MTSKSKGSRPVTHIPRSVAPLNPTFTIRDRLAREGNRRTKVKVTMPKFSWDKEPDQ